MFYHFQAKHMRFLTSTILSSGQDALEYRPTAEVAYVARQRSSLSHDIQ